MQNDKLFIGNVDGNTYDLHDMEQRIEFGRQKWERYINKCARKYKNTVSSSEDFVDEADLIIVNAAQKWNPAKYPNTQFATYVFSCLKHGLMDLSTKTRQAVSIPSGSYKTAGAINTVQLPVDLIDQKDESVAEFEVLDIIHSIRDHEIAELYFIQGYTMQEIGDEVGESRSTIHRRITDIKRLMYQRLK